MTPIDAYERYLAIKCHWDDSGYDFFRYDGKVKITQAAFNRRNDKRIFAAACRTLNIEDWTDLLVISIVDSNKMPFVGELLDGDRLARGRAWQQRKKDSLAAFRKDIDILKVRFVGTTDELVRNRLPSPALLRFYWQKLIWPDTLVHLNRILRIRKYYDKHLTNDPLWPDLSRHILKLSKFVPEIPTNVAEDVLFSAFPLPNTKML